MRYDKLSLLMDQVNGYLKTMGLFRANASGAVLSRQHGVIRTNCMDNLDRTNVVQVGLAAGFTPHGRYCASFAATACMVVPCGGSIAVKSSRCTQPVVPWLAA